MIMRGRYERAVGFAEFLRAARSNAELWQALARRASVEPEMIVRVESVGGQWHLLVLADDWCGDAVNIVPVVAALAEGARNLDLRIVPRDANADLMDAHLTRGSRSIPIVILLDADYEERGWWGPRPTVLQEWVQSHGRGMPKDERYREIRRWYARDRGRVIAREVVELMECAARVRVAA